MYLGGVGVMQKQLTEKVKIETPIGSVESDSGNHLIDVVSVVILFFVVAKIFQKIKAK